MTYRHNAINKTSLDIDAPVLESLTFVYWPFFFVFQNFLKHICPFRTLPISVSFSAPKTMLKRNCRPQDIAFERESLSANLSPPKQDVLGKFEQNFFLFLHRKKENIKTKRGDSIVELLQAKKIVFFRCLFQRALDTQSTRWHLTQRFQQAEISHAHRFPLEEERFARETKRREVMKSGCIIRWLAGIFFLLQSQQVFCNSINTFLKHFFNILRVYYSSINELLLRTSSSVIFFAHRSSIIDPYKFW